MSVDLNKFVVMFDMLCFFLYGVWLIEVLVGIGKIYIIVGLYLCLVFGYGCVEICYVYLLSVD